MQAGYPDVRYGPGADIRPARAKCSLNGQDCAYIAIRASGICQYYALGLKPWQTPPCRLGPDAEQRPADKRGRLLLQRLLAAGLSRYEPDPLRALAEAAMTLVHRLSTELVAIFTTAAITVMPGHY